MIRILIVDDHPAMRAGLRAVLRAEPGLVPLNAASSVADLWPTLNRTKPTPVSEIATTLGVNPEDVMHRIDRMIKRLKIEIPAPRGAG